MQSGEDDICLTEDFIPSQQPWERKHVGLREAVLICLNPLCILFSPCCIFFYLLNETNSFRKKLQITRCIFTAIINRIIWWKKNTALIFLQYSWSVGPTQPLIGIKPRWMNHACGHHMTQMLFGNQRIFKVHVSCSCRTAHPVYPNAPRKGTAFGDGIAVSLKIRE